MEKQRKRSDININDTWNLDLIYENIDDFKKDLNLLKKDIKLIKKYENKILNSSTTLLEFLKLSDLLERRLLKLYYYTHLNLDTDTTNINSQKLSGEVTNLMQEYGILESFVLPELMKGDYNTVLKYIDQNKELEVYRFNLENIYRYKEHSLNEVENSILNRFAKSLGTSETYEVFTDADMSFPKIKVDNKKIELTESNYGTLIRSSNRDTRKKAFKGILGTYSNYKNTFANLFSGNIDYLTSIAKLKKFNSSLEASLYNDNVSTDIYNNLIKAVNSKLDILYHYYDLKRRMIKVDKLHLYDIYTPMVHEYNKNYSFNEAKELVFKALSVLGEDYINNLKKAFDERWIDIYNNKGKRGGAYSSGFYDTKPYLLLNFENKYEDVTTLAHELGHSMHTYYSCNNNPYNLASYNIFVAEVASTVNELLLIKYLINNTENKEEKKFYLNQLMELYKGTIYRQVMFAEFERDMHADYEKNIILTNEYLSKKYLKLVKKYFGKNVVCDKLIENEWMRIPHFYYNFYVYKYAIGLSSATKIVNNILNDKEKGVKDYINFLKTGGRDYPVNELKVANIDVLDENLYIDAMIEFENIINEFEKLI